MRLTTLLAGVLSAAAAVHAGSWTYTAGNIDIDGTPHAFKPDGPPVVVRLDATQKLKLQLTPRLDGDAKRPHQCMVVVRDSRSSAAADAANAIASAPEAALMVPFKAGTSRGSLALSQKDFGPVFLSGSGAVDIVLAIGGFGDDTPLQQHVATIEFVFDPKSPAPTAPTVARYGPRPEITHTFRADQKMPPVVVSLVFSGAVLVGLVGLVGAWAALGGDLADLGGAVQKAPVAYLGFLGAVFGVEAFLVVYWLQLRIFTAIAALFLSAAVAFFTGRPALDEVKRRRLAGLR